MAEEQSPQAQPSTNAQAWKVGDYFMRAGKIYVYEITGYKTIEGKPQLTFEWVDKGLGLDPSKFGGKKLVTPPTGLIADATGYTLEQQQADQDIIDASNAKTSKYKISLGSMKPVGRPTEGSAYRYPMPGAGEGGIAVDGDYVLFNFKDYEPPYGNQRTATDGAFDYNQAGEYTNSTGFKPVMLYMPEDISTGFKTNWDGKAVSNLGTDALRALGQEGMGAKTAGAITTLKNFTDKMKPLAGAAIVKSATSKLSGDTLSYDDIFGGISGAILNPNTELLFGGVQLRNFSLNFKLVPRHEKESKEVAMLIKQFKKAMLPTKAPGQVFGTDNKGVTLGFIGVPKLIQVSFMKGAAENSRLPKFKMCALTSVDVNYTPDGAYATYKDGQPVAVGLSLSFQETKICFSEEVGTNVN